MRINWKLVVDFLMGIAWPSFAAIAIFLLRKPLAALVAQIARRARKLSVYEVSVELATLPEFSPSWSAGSADVRQLTSSLVFDSASQSLFQELLQPEQADYAVVDLGTGQKWLTSRLFIFAVVLGSARRLRAFVFLETVGGSRKRFLGIATPLDVHKALSKSYPWLDEAYVRAAAAQYPAIAKEEPGVSRFPPVFVGTEQRIVNVVRTFIDNIQRIKTPPDAEKTSHLEIGTSPQVWERAHWIDGERLERDLAGVLEHEWCEDSPDQPENSLVEAIARRHGEFVALVDTDRRFVKLVDRYALLDRAQKDSWKRGGSEVATE